MGPLQELQNELINNILEWGAKNKPLGYSFARDLIDDYCRKAEHLKPCNFIIPPEAAEVFKAKYEEFEKAFSGAKNGSKVPYKTKQQ